jgi:dihydroorotate dehydrogenase
MEDDREKTHKTVFSHGAITENIKLLRSILKRSTYLEEEALQVNAFGLNFKNPFGIAAGLDKNAELLSTLSCLGPGFIDVGTVTYLKQPGAEENMRIVALKEDFGLINKLGFPSLGADLVRSNISSRELGGDVLIGGNVGPNTSSLKNADTTRLFMPKDCANATKLLLSSGKIDFITINSASPNTPGLADTQKQKDITANTILAVKEATGYYDSYYQLFNRKYKTTPIRFKISPNLIGDDLNNPNWQYIETLIDVATQPKTRVDCLVIGNTTTNPNVRSNLKSRYRDREGGISGKPLKDLNNMIARHVFLHTEGRIPIAYSGGISSAADTIEAIACGATFVEVLTGLVEESTSTPYFFHDLKRGTLDFLSSNGLKTLSEIRGDVSIIPYIK